MGERGWLKLEASSLPALGEGWAGAPQGSQETPSALRFLGHHRTGLALGWCVLQQRSRVVRVLWAQGCAEGAGKMGTGLPRVADHPPGPCFWAFATCPFLSICVLLGCGHFYSLDLDPWWEVSIHLAGALRHGLVWGAHRPSCTAISGVGLATH